MNYITLCGLVAGGMGNSPALMFAYDQTRSQRAGIPFAAVSPYCRTVPDRPRTTHCRARRSLTGPNPINGRRVCSGGTAIGSWHVRWATDSPTLHGRVRWIDLYWRVIAAKTPENGQEPLAHQLFDPPEPYVPCRDHGDERDRTWHAPNEQLSAGRLCDAAQAALDGRRRGWRRARRGMAVPPWTSWDRRTSRRASPSSHRWEIQLASEFLVRLGMIAAPPKGRTDREPV